MVSRPGGHGTSVVSDSKTKSVCCYGTALFLHYSDVINLQPCKSLIGTHGLHCRELTIQIYVEDDKKCFIPNAKLSYLHRCKCPQSPNTGRSPCRH